MLSRYDACGEHAAAPQVVALGTAYQYQRSQKERVGCDNPLVVHRAVAPRLFCMVGSAAVTAVSSMNAMLDPRIVAARIHGAAFGAQGESASSSESLPRRTAA